ncbi:hypothetical protein NQZ79_g3208 [Umbelopsis isabellina]|nr:hypothetical protein NQZ79_g3208 [Umbelopsis isabellina]
MAVVHRDTSKIEREIERLQELASQRQLDKNGQEKLKKLREELENTVKAKEAAGIKPDSAAASTAQEESRKLVFDAKKGAFVPMSKKKQQRLEAKRAKRDQNDGSDGSDGATDTEDESEEDESDNELLPELPVIKGEDLMEEEEAAAKASQKVEGENDFEMVADKEDIDDEGNEDVPMPGAADSEEDSDIESIPMPEGPPPPKPFERQIPQAHQGNLARPPPPPPGGPGRHYRPPPSSSFRPPPPPPRPHNVRPSHPMHYRPPTNVSMRRPPPPPAQPIVQLPVEAYAPAEVYAPAEPIELVDTVAATAPVTISAAPQVRDLQKELVGFVPAAVRKKQLQAGKKGAVPKVVRPNINAAPDLDDQETVVSSTLSPQLPEKPAANEPSAKPGDEYERFMREMEGIL